MNPILLTSTGELPNGLTMERIAALGLTPVHPTEVPNPDDGFIVEEAAPELVDGRYFQRWRQVGANRPERPTLDALKSEATKLIDQLHADALIGLTGSPTQAEMATWAGKVTLAEAIHAGTQLSVSQQAFLDSNGIPPSGYSEFAKSVLDKSAQYWRQVGIADRVRSDCKYRINAAQTNEQLEQAIANNTAQYAQALASASAKSQPILINTPNPTP